MGKFSLTNNKLKKLRYAYDPFFSGFGPIFPDGIHL